MADRIGVIDRGELMLVEDKRALIARLGRTEARIALAVPLDVVPAALAGFTLTLANDGRELSYRGGHDPRTAGGARAGAGADPGIAALLKAMVTAGIEFTALDVRQSSLEDIFVDLIGRTPAQSDGGQA